MAPSNREHVYQVIDGERAYQNQRFPAVDGISATPEGFLLVIEELSRQARTAWVQTDTPKDGVVALEFLRKIAATAVRAMEQHGAIARENF